MNSQIFMIQLVSKINKMILFINLYFHNKDNLQLLEKDPSKRLGIKNCKHGDVTEQPFFRHVNFDKLEKKQVVPPYKPKVVSSNYNHFLIHLNLH